MWQSVVNVVMNLWVSIKVGTFLTCHGPFSLSEKDLPYAVSVCAIVYALYMYGYGFKFC
jgi:hypothetical protein